MPNTEKMRELADYIEANDRVLFDMDTLVNRNFKLGPHFCGTAACLAGFQYLKDGGDPDSRDRVFADRDATKALGLDMEQADWLFYPKVEADAELRTLSFRRITRDQALRVLRAYADQLDRDPSALPDWTEVAEENGDI